MIYLLDTNALLGFLVGFPHLSRRALSVISRPDLGDKLAIPSICLVEAWDVARKKRRQFTDYNQVNRLIRSRGILVETLTLTVVQKLPDLWEDSRDMVILATAMDLQERHGPGNVTIITTDSKFHSNPLALSCLC